jgi:hypothetical protein
MMTFTYMSLGILSIRLRLFPQSPLHLKHTFPTFGKTLYAGRVKPLVEASELFTHAVSARRHPQNGVFRVRPAGGPKRWQSEGAKWRL